MAKKAVVDTVDTSSKDATCPHCNKTVVVSGETTEDKVSGKTVRPAHVVNKSGMPGHFCEHCNGPLDELALQNTNTNIGDDGLKARYREDLKSKVAAFQESLA